MNGIKYCTNCGNLKSTDSFYPAKGKAGSFRLYCKECESIKSIDKKRVENVATASKVELSEVIHNELEKEIGIKKIRSILYEDGVKVSEEVFLKSKLFDRSERQGQWYLSE